MTRKEAESFGFNAMYTISNRCVPPDPQGRRPNVVTVDRDRLQRWLTDFVHQNFELKKRKPKTRP